MEEIKVKHHIVGSNTKSDIHITPQNQLELHAENILLDGNVIITGKLKIKRKHWWQFWRPK